MKEAVQPPMSTLNSITLPRGHSVRDSCFCLDGVQTAPEAQKAEKAEGTWLASLLPNVSSRVVRRVVSARISELSSPIQFQ
uniref:Uncharacterized protein n=1 Tax=Steinernema glaseri TaxID=37863 RepID=A0A1I8A5N4_9BILA